MQTTSSIDLSPTSTASTSGFKRLPWHSSQIFSIIYCSISSLAQSESVSWYLRSNHGIPPSNSSSPCSTRSTTFLGSSCTGTSRENPYFFAASSSFHQKNPCLPILWEAWAQGNTAPSARESLGFGMTSFGSTSSFSPKPWHEGHAPKGELKENSRGSMLGSEMPQ